MCVKIKIQKYTETVTETDRQTVGGNIIQISAGQQTIPSGCDATFRDSSKKCSTSSLWWTKAKLQTSSLLFTVYSYGLRSTVYNSGAGIRAAIASAGSSSSSWVALRSCRSNRHFQLQFVSRFRCLPVCLSVFLSVCLPVCSSVCQLVTRSKRHTRSPTDSSSCRRGAS